MTGWYRFNGRSLWHLFRPWPKNEIYLAPTCGRGLTVRRSVPLKSQAELPEGAMLCKACSSQDDVGERKLTFDQCTFMIADGCDATIADVSQALVSLFGKVAEPKLVYKRVFEITGMRGDYTAREVVLQ